MKNLISFLMIIASLLFTGIANAAAENYTLDPHHSYVLWHISHFDFSHQSGKWMIDKGKLSLDKEKPQDSKVDILIQVGDIITGVPELDKHLKDSLFFDVAKYPQATFVSNKVVLTGKNSAKVYGILTMHGISHPIMLNVKLNKMGISPITNKETVGFTASTTLKRSDFGITSLLPGLGDQVQINIEAEAYKS